MKPIVLFELANLRWTLKWLLATAFLFNLRGVHSHPSDVSNITRLEDGDTFSFKGAECIKRECGGRSESLSCFCACPPHAPLFREDRAECVDDIAECSMALFGTGMSAQRVPYVFLPLKGQIIHPSKEISFPGVRTPICAVSGAQYLTRNGFVDLRNKMDADVPFTLFRDEGRTFLQWTGEAEIRTRMEGRLLVVHLLCRDVGVSNSNPRGLHGVFTPCAAFRVAGSPTRLITNVSEVIFSPDARSSDDTSASSLTVSEYIAIGVCSVLLGLIYVASIFLYLHIKRKRSNRDACPESPKKSGNKTKKKVEKLKEELQAERERHGNKLTVDEDGVIKNNPLLGMGRHFHNHNREGEEFDTESGDSPTDADETSNDVPDDDTNEPINQIASVIVHPVVHNENSRKNYYRSRLNEAYQIRDDSGFERLPEENVSIVETMDFRDEKPETVRAIGTTRRKLYFNPAYFEPHLLMTPPPAAVEFLVKIREVISVAKHKMASKKFTPSLIGIPEEEAFYSFDNNFFHVGSQRSSMVSLKRENNRRRPHCSGCPGCESVDIQNHSPYIPEIRSLGACHSCSSANNINKQTNVRKWLEGVPITNNAHPDIRTMSDMNSNGNSGLLNSLLSLPKEKSEPPRKYYDFTSRSLYEEDNSENFIFKKKASSVKSEPPYKKYSIPLPNFNHIPQRRFENERTVAKINDISPIGLKPFDSRPNKANHMQTKKQIRLVHAMPDMINEALAIDKNLNEKSPLRMAVEERILKEKQESAIKSLDSIIEKQKQPLDYETDSLERNQPNRELSTPTEYAEISSSQASPSLSSALPMDEEMTMTNAVYKGSPQSRPNSRHSMKNNETKAADKKVNLDNSFDNHIYTLPEIQHTQSGDYSLVTEVYVNNGYNFGSTPSSPTDSEYSTFGRRKTTIKGPEELPGHLTIELKDSPEDYIKIHESDGFEPDTLDRKPTKIKINIGPSQTLERNFTLSSLPESKVIENIKSTGIFRSSSLVNGNNLRNNIPELTCLKEAYEPFSNRSQKSVDSRDYEIIENNAPLDSEEGRLLTLESRHCRRQRQCTPPNTKGRGIPIPPDVIPPIPPEQSMSIYEYPKPPRKVSVDKAPPLPPKNENGRSPSSRRPKYSNDNSTAITKLKELARSPSGASVKSAQSSDYEQVNPVDDDPKESTNKAPNKIITKPTGKINFRELQTPKANKKQLRSNVSLRKSIKDRKEGEIRKQWRRGAGNQHKEDSGYLSTDSNESRKAIKKRLRESKISGSDTEDSVEDARSESGAESVETHSVFFGSLRKVSSMNMENPSADSNLKTMDRIRSSFCNREDLDNSANRMNRVNC